MAAAGLVAAPAAAESSGHVVDPDGKPVVGARACLMLGVEGRVEGLCIGTDEHGYYRLPSAGSGTVRIVADGFLPSRVAEVNQESPIVLERAASILVRVVDAATGSPVPSSEVRLAFASGESKGPFPAKRAGVRIAKLPPGDVIPTASAKGYKDAKGISVTLVAGRESEVVLRLERE